MNINFDVDIDMADRDAFLKVIDHVPASIKRANGYEKHKTGVYFQPIPKFCIEDYSTIDHKQAEQLGYFKVDFLNNSVYKDIESESQLNRLISQEPIWSLLEEEDFVKMLFHISNYSSIVKDYKPVTVEQLAMILAIIRPAKKHLQGLSFDEISKTVWDKPDDDSYYFKKSHAIAYALTIVVQMNLISEKAISG